MQAGRFFEKQNKDNAELLKGEHIVADMSEAVCSGQYSSEGRRVILNVTRATAATLLKEGERKGRWKSELQFWKTSVSY